MGRAFKIVIGLLTIIGAATVALWLSVPYLISCEGMTLAIADSPDGRWTARVSAERCKDDPARTAVFVRLERPDEESSVELLRAPLTSTDIRLHWTRQGDLRIAFPETLPVSEGAPQVDGIRVILDRVSDREL